MVKGDYKKIPSNPPPLPQQTQLTVGRHSPSLEKCSHDVYYKSTSIKVVPFFYSDWFSRTYICRLLEVLFKVWDKQCMYLYMFTVGIHHDVQVSLKESLWQLSLSLKWIKQRESETDNYIISTRVHV